MRKRSTASRRRRARPLAAALATGALVVAASALVGASLVVEARKALHEEVRLNLLSLAHAGAAVVDGDLHRTFTSPEQEGSQAYAEAVAPLERIRASSPDLEFVYTLVLVDGKPAFVLDPTPEGDGDGDGVDDKSHVMEPYPEADPSLVAALRTRTARSDGQFYTDRWGTFMSAYAPFHDSAGRFVGVVGVDINVARYAHRIAALHRAALSGIALALALAVLVGASTFTLGRAKERVVQRHEALMGAVRDAQEMYIASTPGHVLFDEVLTRFLELTRSRSGYVAEVAAGPQRDPVLEVRAARLAGTEGGGAEGTFEDVDLGPLSGDTPCGTVLRTGRPLHLRAPVEDPRGAGFPASPPAPTSILLMPLRRGEDVVGLVALADAADGFREEAAESLEPLLAALAAIVDSRRAEALLHRYTSELEHLQARLEEQSTELVRARDQALAAAHAKSTFLASMSHEIRTPMSGVIGLTQVLLGTRLTDDQRECARVIETSGQALLAIVDDILHFSKLEAGRVKLRLAPFELRTLVSGVFDVLRAQAQAKGVALAADVADDVPEVLVGDAGRIRQVLMNLVGNALKFTDEGIVRVEVTRAPASGAGRAGVHVEVHDTGPGIAPADQAGLFRAFCQADDSASRRHAGTGLGLAISKQLVELMGGRMGLTSAPGVGSTFWFALELDLPAREQDDTASPSGDDAARDPATELPSWPRLHALVAEDNVVNQVVASRFLRRLGCTVEVVSSGAEAVRAHARGGHDVVFMDCRMPDMDGFAATAAIRANEAGAAHVPIIALTANALDEDRERCLRAGMDDHLAKPVSLEALARVLARVASGWPEPAGTPAD